MEMSVQVEPQNPTNRILPNQPLQVTAGLEKDYR